ncbi:MAG: PAS domain S-box protein [Acidobacteria bacterium]|nr:PAS domain S-box protein [Acidobacteriota bacterium]
MKPFEPKTLQSSIEIALYKHRMETRLKESESRFRTLAESAPVGIFQTDLNGNCIYVNEKWAQITGLTKTGAVGLCWAERIHPEDLDNAKYQWEQMSKQGEKFAMEYRYLAPDGKITWVFGQAVSLEHGKDCRTGYMGTINDITDRKRLEEKLLTAKKLESLGILAGGIAHDFNNLLSVIMGNITMVKDEVVNNKDLFRMLATAERASGEAAALAQKLTTFSKGGWLQKKKVFLTHIIKISMNQVLTDTGFTAKTDLPTDLFYIDGDESQLAQVFENILSNALDALKEKQISAGDKNDGNIIIRAQNRTIHAHESQQVKPGKYVRITIEDNGTGISPDHLGKVFDPYFSTKNISSRKGMGLGLAICYSILTKHEGSIRLESEMGKGTTVEILLPAFREIPLISH